MSKFIVAFTSIILLTLTVIVALPADIPQLISFQGKLYNSEGNPLTGEYEIIFRLYDAWEESTYVWTETIAVNCENGLYSVILGKTAPLNLDFDGQYWLSVQVTGDDELLPRYRLVSVPTAFRAQVADQVSWTNLTDVPTGFADGTDDVGEAGGGISQIDEGVGIQVTNPTGPTATVAADIGTGANQVAAGNHNHNDVYSLVGHDHDPDYVNEGQTNSITGGMIVDGTIQPEDLGFTPGGDNEWTVNGNDIYRNIGNVGIGTTSPSARLEALATSGTGVYGGSSSGSGVVGFSDSGSGLVGTSTSGHAGYFLGDVYVSGNVGIGTEIPIAKLEVMASLGTTGVRGESNTGVGVVGINWATGNSGHLGGSVSSVYGYTRDGVCVYGDCYGSGWAGYFIGRTYISGNVGIGTTSPDYTLDIAGPMNLNKSHTGAALRVDGDEALWYNGTYFSWGYGGTANYFADNVGIGTTTPGYKLHVIGDIAYTGDIHDVSDIRLKENITPLENAVQKISSINSIYFNNKGEPPEKREVGVIAQEVEKVLPEIVFADDQGYKSVAYSKLTPLLIEAVKEQQSQIETLKAENEELREDIKNILKLLER